METVLEQVQAAQRHCRGLVRSSYDPVVAQAAALAKSAEEHSPAVVATGVCVSAAGSGHSVRLVLQLKKVQRQKRLCGRIKE